MIPEWKSTHYKSQCVQCTRQSFTIFDWVKGSETTELQNDNLDVIRYDTHVNNDVFTLIITIYTEVTEMFEL